MKPDTLSLPPHTPAVTLSHSEIQDLLQGAQQNATALQTECKLVPAASLPGLWSRLKDADGLGLYLLSNGAIYIDNISPTICSTNADAVRCARLELGQFESSARLFRPPHVRLRRQKQKPVADDFGQTVAQRTMSLSMT